MSKTPWLDVARDELGVKEFEGKKLNPRIAEYYKATGYPQMDDSVPWCSAFANWVMAQVGIRGSMSLAARSWLKWGKPSAPVPGAIAIFPRGTKSWQGHVTIVEKVSADTVVCIGGNQGDEVNRRTYKISNALGFRMPSTMGGSRTVKAQFASLGGGAVGLISETANQFLPIAQEASYWLDVAQYAAFGLAIVAALCTLYFKYQDIKKERVSADDYPE